MSTQLLKMLANSQKRVGNMACMYNALMHLLLSVLSAHQAQHHVRRITRADRLTRAIEHTLLCCTIFLCFAGDCLFEQLYCLCL